jgi:hypothetical protein
MHSKKLENRFGLVFWFASVWVVFLFFFAGAERLAYTQAGRIAPLAVYALFDGVFSFFSYYSFLLY